MIERRPFGRTNHSSTVTLFGTAALARASQADADRALELLLRHGVNHILLPRVLDAASRFEGRPADEAMAAMFGATRMTSLFGLPT